MLEIFVKSYYLEFIAKEKGDNVNAYIDGKKEFPNFFQMTKELEEVKDPKGGGFNGVFSQFTKRHLASYEKFSLFSHGKGELLKAYYDNEKMSYTTEQITDVLKMVKGMFSTIGILLFFTQNMKKELIAFSSRIDLS